MLKNERRSIRNQGHYILVFLAAIFCAHQGNISECLAQQGQPIPPTAQSNIYGGSACAASASRMSLSENCVLRVCLLASRERKGFVQLGAQGCGSD